jgi:hypothetical protein
MVKKQHYISEAKCLGSLTTSILLLVCVCVCASFWMEWWLVNFL